MPVRKLINCTASMLAGAGVGAAAMYLLDPEQGPARRERIRQRSARALAQAGAAASVAMEHARETAVDLSHRTAATYHHLRDRDLQEQVRYLAFSRRPRQVVASASPLMVASAVVGAAALGAALMFLLDPQAGPTRRSILKNHARRAARDVRGYLQRFTGRFRPDAPGGGPATELSGDQAAADEALAARIRSEILLSFPHPQDIYVSCAAGEVTLHGSLPEADQMALIARIRQIPGITAIHNNLRVAEGTRG